MTPPRRRRALLLPVAAAGIAIVLPWRAFELMQGWQAYASETAATVSAPATQVAAAEHAVVPPSSAPQQSPAMRLTDTSYPDDQSADSGLLNEIARRNAELDAREHEVALREMQLAAATKLAQAEIAQLERMREKVQTLVGRETTAAEADIQLLVGLYSNMKPAQAAAVMNKLDPPKAAMILQHLETRMAGPILAAMDPSSAMKVTEELEQRHAAFVQ